MGISKNPALIKLSCKNKLTSLDLSKNTRFNYLGCSKNKLTNLDVSSNAALTYLVVLIMNSQV